MAEHRLPLPLDLARVADARRQDRPAAEGRDVRAGIGIIDRRVDEELLAGGLNPANIAEAVKSVHPHGIDVSSGVESSPGLKDHGKLTRLFSEIRRIH